MKRHRVASPPGSFSALSAHFGCTHPDFFHILIRMKNENGERYCRAFDALVKSIDKAVHKYRSEAQKCLGNERTSALATWIMGHKPKLEASVRGLQVLITWLEEAKACNKAGSAGERHPRSLSEGNLEERRNNFDCLLSSAESIQDDDVAASEDSMTLLDTMIGSMEEYTGQPLLQVFDEFPNGNDDAADTTNGDSLQHKSPPRRSTHNLVNQTPSSPPSNNEASWERSYYTFQNALIRYKDIEGLEAIAVNKQVSVDDQRAATELIIWSQQQRVDRQNGRLNESQITKLDSLVRRRMWCWDVPRGRSQAQSSQHRQSGSFSDHAPLRELYSQPAFPASEDTPSASASSASAATAVGKKVARKVVAKKIPRKKIRGKVSAEEKAQNLEWSEYFHLLQLYGSTHENYQVPQEYVTRNSRGEEVALGVWLYVQMISLEEYMTEAPQWYEALAELIQEGKLWPVDHSASSSASGTVPAASATAARTSAGGSRGSSPDAAAEAQDAKESPGTSSRGVKRRMSADQGVSQSSSRSASPHQSTSSAHAHKKGAGAQAPTTNPRAATEFIPASAAKPSHAPDPAPPPAEAANFSLKNKELFRRSGDLSDASRETYADEDVGVSLPRPSLSNAGSTSAGKPRFASAKTSTATSSTESAASLSPRPAAAASNPASSTVTRQTTDSAVKSSNSMPRRTNAEPSALASDAPSVSLLPEVYVALTFSYGDGADITESPLCFGLGRVICGDTAEGDGTVEVEMLTAQNGVDPVRSSYRRAGNILTTLASALLLRDLRMVQGKDPASGYCIMGYLKVVSILHC
jgi:hypothetical protein